MASEAIIVPGTLLHCRQLGFSMRAADRAELAAIGDVDVLPALERYLASSDKTWAVTLDGLLGCMAGVAPVKTEGAPAGLGQFWFLTAELFGRRPRPFFRVAAAVVDLALELYPVLFNYIDARYTGALRFADFMGAEFLPPVPLGPQSLPFVPFRLRRHPCVA